MLRLLRAEVSTNAQPSSFAVLSPSCAETCLRKQEKEKVNPSSCTTTRQRPSPLFDIVFGAHNDAGNGVFADKISDLVVNDFDHLEGFAGSDRVDEDVAVDSYRIFGIQYGEFILRLRRDDQFPLVYIT
jgi:hypothetical protein